MPNSHVLKKFIHPKAEPYQFPTAEQLDAQDEFFVEKTETLGGAPEDAPPRGAAEEIPPKGAPEKPDPEQVSFAAVQADAIVKAAEAQATEILRSAKAEAEETKALSLAQARQELDQIREGARQEGYREGYAQGLASAAEENKRVMEEQAHHMEGVVQRFLENATRAHDDMIDKAQEDMRDLAIAVAEKVVRVSLKSSGGIIARMIQGATENLKHKEWVRIYVSGCDSKTIAQITPRLTASLSALSDRIKIIPMADEDAGTCIIETPDAIIDASASTQLDNIGALLSDIPADDGAPTLLSGRRPARLQEGAERV